MIKTVLDGLHERLLQVWSSETSADPDGYADPGSTKSYGQCAVTALLVQDRLGGALLRTEADGVSHYFNLLPSGASVDLTRDQFPVTTQFSLAKVRERDYVLSHPETARRYELLKQRVSDLAVESHHGVGSDVLAGAGCEAHGFVCELVEGSRA